MVEFYDEKIKIRYITLSEELKDELSIYLDLDAVYSKAELPTDLVRVLDKDVIKEYKEAIELSLDSFNNNEADLIRFE